MEPSFNWIEKVKFWFATVRFLVSICFMLNFMYCMILDVKRRKLDPDSQELCVAKLGVNHPITITELTDLTFVTLVGVQFYRLNITGFSLNFVNILQALYCLFAPRNHGKIANTSTGVFLEINGSFLCWVTALRYCHAGKVCSGDYLYY